MQNKTNEPPLCDPIPNHYERRPLLARYLWLTVAASAVITYAILRIAL